MSFLQRGTIAPAMLAKEGIVTGQLPWCLTCLLVVSCMGSACRRKQEPESQGPPLIVVAKARIFFDGRPVLASQGSVSSDERLLPALRGQLGGIAEERRSPEVKACFHKDALFRIVKRVAYTCGKAGLTHLSVGIGTGDPPAGCSAKLDAERLTQPTKGAPSLSRAVHGIHLERRGYVLLFPEMKIPVRKRDGAYDTSMLTQALRGPAARQRTVVASADDAVTLSDVITALQTGRAAGYGTTALADLAAEVERSGHLWSGHGPGVGGLSPEVLRRKQRRRAPRIIAGRAEVRGGLSKEVVRRVIRRHINQIKHCYMKRLEADPELAGRVLVQFTVSPDGRVASSRIQSSTMNSPPVEGCIRNAVRRWLFPKPKGGGIVLVAYPFAFRAAR